MEKHGPDFYDNQAVIDTYIGHRSSGNAPNENIEQPILWNLIGDVRGKHVLDLGCGDARVSKRFRELGAATYLGIEGSKKMVALAKENLEPRFSDVLLSWLEKYEPERSRYDLVTSSLALHYIDDLKLIFQRVNSALKPNGQFVFSVEHPFITSNNESLEKSPVRGAWIVDNYFERGSRTVEWMGDVVTKYHRTIEDFLNLLVQTGFSIERLRESDPQPEHFSDPELLHRRRRIPLFLIISARKA